MEQQSQAGLRAFGWTLLLVFSAAAFMLRGYAVTLIMGILLAVLSYPLHRKLMIGMMKSVLLKHRARPALSAFIVTLTVVFLFLGPLAAFAAAAVKQGILLIENISETNALSFETIGETVIKWPFVEDLLGGRNLESELKNAAETAARALSKAALSFAKSLPEGVIKFFLMVATCFFFLKDGKRLFDWTYQRVPLSTDVRDGLAQAFANTAISVVWATMAAAGVQASLMTIAFLVLNIPAAFFAGGVTFVFAFVPFLGSVPVWGFGSVFLILSDSPGKAVALLVIGLFTATIDNFVRPWVLKGRNEMHPLLALVAIIGGIQTLGFAGVFLGPIVAALLVSMLQIWPMIWERHGLEFK